MNTLIIDVGIFYFYLEIKLTLKVRDDAKL